MGAWTHVLLTFSNDTAALEEAAKGEEGVRYAMSLFLNGRHDVSVKYRLPAFANDGMLSIGTYSLSCLTCSTTSCQLMDIGYACV